MRLMTRCCAADVPVWYPPWHRPDAIRMLQKTSWLGWRIWTQADETRWSCDVSSPWVQASQSQWPPKLATLLWVMISRYRDDTWNWTLYLGRYNQNHAGKHSLSTSMVFPQGKVKFGSHHPEVQVLPLPFLMASLQLPTLELEALLTCQLLHFRFGIPSLRWYDVVDTTPDGTNVTIYMKHYTNTIKKIMRWSRAICLVFI